MKTTTTTTETFGAKTTLPSGSLKTSQPQKEKLVLGATPAPAANLAQFAMIKNVEGALSVNLDSYDGSTPPRRIEFKSTVERRYVTRKYAIGVFVSHEALEQMEKGYFTFAEMPKLVEQAEAEGFYVPEAIKTPKVTLRELSILMTTSNLKGLQSKMQNATKKTQTDIVGLGRSLYKKLNIDIVDLIESTYKVQLRTVEINA